MNKIIKYRFNIEAITPVYFGSEEKGEFLKNSYGNPFITGNSIGGAIRSFLEKYMGNKENIIEVLGGEAVNEEKLDFIESNAIITDGIIAGSKEDICIKEGTRINRRTSTADDGSKYEFEYLDIGTRISFEIEMECNDENEIKFKTIIKDITNGISDKKLTLGGQVTNGFGQFKINQIEKKEFNLDSIEGLKEYIFKRNDNNLHWKKVNVNNNASIDNCEEIKFILKGGFPYGVYQNYDYDIEKNFKLSGIQRGNKGYYIPASSIKGLMKSEIEKLYNSLGVCSEDYVLKLFGGQNSIGRIIFKDIILNNANEIEVFYPKKIDGKSKEEDKYPTYNKVDRLVGSSYTNALFKQREIEGQALIELSLNNFVDNKEFVYPILTILRNIGLGLIPIGGRTSVGLGEFEAEEMKVTIKDYEVKIDFNIDSRSIEIKEDKEKLDDFRKAFKKSLEKGWVKND
ncbi:RAMP superfamily CRISPR-associated protein [Clostridiisalibacter paucivorans]|uniref:RAMP superfamily CRISPR-associated protein n=1 Tax=Clostridiisalibacter paucivorans TaxID=408753 RepID=UPI00047971C0|nr:RAMP superfamily CRISPR-associated protein [Clostridiisalibacter paucivorans]